MLLLDKLIVEALISDMFRRCMEPFGIEAARNTGELFVLLEKDQGKLINFLKAFCQELKDAGLVFSAGIAKSIVLVEKYGTKSNMIAGMGINIASKLAEDVWEAHTILVHDSAEMPGAELSPFTFTKPVSHITLTGWGVRL